MRRVQPEEFEPSKDTEMDFGDLVQQFDVNDTRLCMAYARFIENPGDARYDELDSVREELMGDFENILEAIDDDTTDPGDDPQDLYTEIIATLLIDTVKKHDEIMAEHSGQPGLTAEAINSQRGSLVACLHAAVAEGDHEEFVSHAMSHFNDLLMSDNQDIKHLADKEMSSPRRKAERIAKRALVEVARIAVASAVAVVVMKKFKK